MADNQIRLQLHRFIYWFCEIASEALNFANSIISWVFGFFHQLIHPTVMSSELVVKTD